MADIGKEFFLAREFIGSNPYMGTHGIPVPTQLHDLQDRAFRPGQGPEFRDFLRGKMNTGERKPRPLPGAVANRVAYLVNRHRGAQEGGRTGYIFQLYGRGGRFVRWTLERLSRKAGRYDPLKMNPSLGPTVRAAKAQGRHVVLKSEMDNLRIRRWHRGLYYRIYLTAFADEGAMRAWRDRYGRAPLFQQNQHREPARAPEQQTVWFETMGWQKLPEPFIARLKSDAKNLVFPSAFRQMREAVTRSSGGLLLAIPLAGYQLARQDDRHGPTNCVWTQYRAHVQINLCTGR